MNLWLTISVLFLMDLVPGVKCRKADCLCCRCQVTERFNPGFYFKFNFFSWLSSNVNCYDMINLYYPSHPLVAIVKLIWLNYFLLQGLAAQSFAFISKWILCDSFTLSTWEMNTYKFIKDSCDWLGKSC